MKYHLLIFLVAVTGACSIHGTGTDAGTIGLDIQAQGSATTLNSRTAFNSHMKGLYFGESNEQKGRRAWFFYFDPEKGKGSLYMPPNNLELHMKTISSDQITFRSETALGGIIYSFDGQFISNSIRGNLYIKRIRPSAKENVSRTSITLRKLDAHTSNKGGGVNISGLYSNVKYNEEGGDVVGEELILIPSEEGFEGIFTSLSNEMIPYLITNIVQSGNALQFDVCTGSGEETYRGTLLPQKVMLKRDDVNTNPDAEQILLFKKRDLFDILTGTQSVP